MSAETDEAAAAALQRTQIAVQLATVNGKIDTVIARMEAGDRQGEQLVALTKDQIKFIAADTGELKAVVRELAAKVELQISLLANKTEVGLSTVRTDLERQVTVAREELSKPIRETADKVDDLRLWRAKVVGIAIGTSALSSGITVGILRMIGAA